MRLGLKLEKWCKPVIFTEKKDGKEGAKKCYAIHVLWQDGRPVDYTVIKGWSYVRRDASPICKHVEKAVLDIALSGRIEDKDKMGLGLPADFEPDLISLVQRVRKKFLGGEYSLENMSIPATARRALDDYQNPPAFVRAILYFNEHIAPKVGRPAMLSGETVRFLYVKRIVGLPPTDVVAVFDFAEVPHIDVNLTKMFNREVRGKLEKKLKVLGITWNRILGQTSMEDFV